MALIVIITNQSALAATSNYRVEVLINDLQLYKGEIKGHRREDGWEALLKQFTSQLTPHKLHRAGAKE